MKREKAFEEERWITNGIGFAVFFFITNSIIIPLIMEDPITWQNTLVVAGLSLISGFLYGYGLMRYLRWRRRRSEG